MSKRQARIDDGCGSEILGCAFFAGKLEIPRVKGMRNKTLPELILPYSLRNKKRNPKKFILLSEPDVDFNDILRHPKPYLRKLRGCAGIITAEPALIRNTNLTAQIAYTYRSRELCLCLRNEGYNVIPHVCWGDERSYAAGTPYEQFVFLGLPKHSVVAVCTCGCPDTEQDICRFKNGLAAMLRKLKPSAVLVFGDMSETVFAEFKQLTQFVSCSDWNCILEAGDAA